MTPKNARINTHINAYLLEVFVYEDDSNADGVIDDRLKVKLNLTFF